MKRSAPTEHQEQTAVIAWWAHACKGYKLPEFALLAIPNAAKRSYALAARMRKEGLRAGVPDLFLAVAHTWTTAGLESAHIPGLWIEMKRKPNKPSPEQAVVLLYLRQHGYHAVIAWSADEAIRAIKGYLA